jgi:NAD+ synthetase
MKIAMAQVNPIIGDFNHNYRQIVTYAEKAKDRGCDLVIFPELAITGYPPRDLLEKRDFIETNLLCLKRLREWIRGIGVICGYAEPNPGEVGNNLFNAAVHFEDGQILQTAYKRLLPTYDIFDERRYFEPGNDFSVYDYKGRRIGLTICEDVWNDTDVFKRRYYPIDPVTELVRKGADLILNISASPYHLGKKAFRRHMLGAIAKKHRVPLVMTNQVGGNDSVLFDGTSSAFDPEGEVAAQAPDFEEALAVFDVASLSGDRLPGTETEPETILKALILGVRDYVRKCGFSKAVIGLSGGIDSALTAYIAARALEPENVLTIFMPSRYTSPDNFTDTRQLADNLGVAYEVVSIDAIFSAFTDVLSPDFREEDPGVTEQNIQARIRGTLLMGISNARGHLVLSTGNKSEMAIGYSTLYGDMNGGLAVISDVPKTLVWELSRHINRDREIIPRRIVDKVPSAELKPDQTDQDDLPPYEDLDQILKKYIEEFTGAERLASMGYDPALVAEVAARVDRNEYKRQQAPPGLKVTSKAFGYGRRYPIAHQYRGAATFTAGKARG